MQTGQKNNPYNSMNYMGFKMYSGPVYALRATTRLAGLDPEPVLNS